MGQFGLNHSLLRITLIALRMICLVFLIAMAGMSLSSPLHSLAYQQALLNHQAAQIAVAGPWGGSHPGSVGPTGAIGASGLVGPAGNIGPSGLCGPTGCIAF